MKQKAIIFDIDGTAIDSPSQKVPTKRLIEAVRKAEKSYYLCAATGRSWTFAKPVLQGLGLKDPCIISGGTRICDPQSGKVLWQSNILSADLEKVLQVVYKYSKYNVIYNDYDEDLYLSGGIPPAQLSINEPVYLLELIFVPAVEATIIAKELSKIHGLTCTIVVAQREGLKDLHVSNILATKEHAIAILLEKLGTTRKSAIGVGDGHNDIHLFNAVDQKVAVGNAVPEIKEMADKVIGPCSRRRFCRLS